MDVRLTVETHDGAIVYITYGGRIDISAGIEGAAVYSTPRFETGNERYQWLNKIQAVAGVISNGVLKYEIYELH
jgi:protein subunit release factor A